MRTKIVHGDNVAGPQRLEDIPAFILIVLLPIAHTGLVRGSSATTLSREPENGEGDMAKKNWNICYGPIWRTVYQCRDGQALDGRARNAPEGRI